MIPPDKKATIVVAYNKNRVIGKGDQIPWHLPVDLKRFRSLTLGHTVIMGRNTWLSLPINSRPLYNRHNIVLSRKFFGKNTNSDGPWYVGTLDEAFNQAKGKIFIIGGEQIYKLALEADVVNKILVTEVKRDQYGDKHFPTLGEEWIETVLEDYDDFSFKEFNKNQTNLSNAGISNETSQQPT